MCGIAMIRLLKPLDYYQKKYGTWQYGLQKMYLLMEKQHNRGQEGAGLATVKLDMPPGEEYIYRERFEGKNAIQDIFDLINSKIEEKQEKFEDSEFAKANHPFAGELYLGHLRYSSSGRTGLSYVHPFLRRHNWKARTLVLAGSFNITNADELFDNLMEQGQHPRDKADTFLMLESLGNQLDREVQREYELIKQRYTHDITITKKIEEKLEIPTFIRKSEKLWDGGYIVCGMLGHGDSFVFRDPKGIRTAFYYADDEIVVVASERPVIQTAMNLREEDIKELNPGETMIIKKDGKIYFDTIRQASETLLACSFERIYVSRGSDFDIYRERKQLGYSLADSILKTIDHDIQNTVFSFIPNTAEVAYYGMVQGLRDATGKAVRVEKVLIKDIKLRTFISQNKERNDLAAHVYDITYGSIRRGKVDNLVVIDDSIVRGTTLKQSIIKILNRLEPKKIVIVSSSPQVRYPDYYGIDMEKMSEFCSFKAAVQLLKETGRTYIIDEVYQKSKVQENLPKEEVVNYVKDIYAPFSNEEIATQIAKMLTSEDINCPVELVFQTIEGLHQACPNHKGDWYFSGNYPTPGGNRLINKAFINYYEGKETGMIKVSKLIFLSLLSMLVNQITGQSRVIFISDIQQPLFVEKFISKNEKNAQVTNLLFKSISSKKPESAFILGDMVGKASNNKLWEKVDNLLNELSSNEIPYYGIRGNHDYIYNKRKAIKNYNNRFISPNVYQVVIDSVAVVLLNSNYKKLSIFEKEQMLLRYNHLMDSLQLSSAIKGIIVCAHHSPYSNSKIVGSSEWVRNYFVPAYIATPKAKLFLSGHSHNLEIFNQNEKYFCVIGGGGGVNQPLGDNFTEAYNDLERLRFFFIELVIQNDSFELNEYGINKFGESIKKVNLFSIPFYK